jgi:hypothetical protein
MKVFLLIFQVFMVMKTQALVFWYVTLCSDEVEYQRFGGIYCFHVQGDVIARSV